MRKIILTKGLPGSGKTTWAKEYQQKNPNTVLVSKDDLRALLHNGVHSKGRESFILAMRDDIVTKALEEGHEVIVHDTNFAPKHLVRMNEIAEQFKANGVEVVVEIQDFTYVPIEVCIERDLKRPNSVGEKVIRTMFNQYLRPKPTPPEAVSYDSSLPDCVLCDLDGTLALFGDANPYDRDFTADKVNDAVQRVIYWKEAANGDGFQREKLIFLSGRQDKFREQTVYWLKNIATVEYDTLYMRKTDDTRKDSIIKRELYEEHIKGKYNVVAVFDDRISVCRLWYELGLPLFRVGDPDADF